TPGAASGGVARAPVNALQIVRSGPPAPDFAVSASPASQSVTQGGTATYTVTASALNGFGGTVALAASALPANTTASFAPASVAGSAPSTPTVTTTAGPPPGSSTLGISGTSGGVSRSAPVPLVVNGPPDFAIPATPASTTVAPGAPASYTVTITPVNGFT